MEAGLMYSALVFLVAAVAVVPLCKRLGLGEVLGYLLAGVAIGPAALGLVREPEQVLGFSQIGIVFLLFIIGLELKLSRLKLMRRAVFVFGGLQLLTASLAIAVIAWLLGLSPTAALIVGFGLGLSSTPLVLQLLGEGGEMQSRQGRYAFSILLFQDMATIPVLALIPFLGAGANLDGNSSDVLGDIVLGLGAFALLILCGRYLLRPLFHQVAKMRSREMFLAAALMVVLGAALLMEQAGLSMALGAFVAGVLLAGSEYRPAIEADIQPFKGLLLGLFFMAVGMTAQVGLLLEEPLRILLLVLGLSVVKFLMLLVATRLFRRPWAVALRLGVLMGHGGEFGFVLFSTALSAGVLEASLADTLILIVSLSIALAPLTNALALRSGLLAHKKPTREYDRPQDHEPRVLIIGFSRFGQVVGRVLQSLQIPFTVLDSDPERVDFVRRYGHQVYFGDASRLDLLEAAGAGRAHLLVLAVSEVDMSLRVAGLIRRRFPRARLLARARDRYHAQQLMRLGVSVVIRELLLSSLEMTRRVLMELGVKDEIAQHTIETFHRHDEHTLARQMEASREEQQQPQSHAQANRELQELFEADAESLTPGTLEEPPPRP
ncbi:monovalent cation:proton antiporter-2 (CPA2) family protein [Halomonas garicola]|uniref:monovalent cation:proton antiporter-2 (CPA2) family protein n=1 Tax=Halomonas garicola TaxID=1690008 RepID=UPI002896E5D6|nr:monovalent cation:proton antiporter-2 (CPA2) family protein [Halomonas garicola]